MADASASSSPKIFMFNKALFPRALCSAAILACVASPLSAAPKDPNPAKTAATPSKPGAAPVKPSVASTKDSSVPAANSVLYVPGSYQSYKPDTAPQIGAVAGSAGMFDGYINITGDGTQGFKFTEAPDWNHTNFGDGGRGTLSKDGQASDLTVTEAGYYEMTVDLNKNTWSATKTNWSVIGNATPGGWEKDTPMTYDPDKQVWSVTVLMKTAGSFKFRANKAWKIDFGLDVDGHLQYADNPGFGYNANIKDLTVPDDGTYTITLDLHVPGKYTYSIDAK